MGTDQAIEAKWGEVAAAVERLAERVGDINDFVVAPGSSLAGDDRAAHPFEISHAIRHIVHTTVDQLHGIKVAVHDAQQQHLAVSTTLARTALENTATGLWILGPRKRSVRLERVLRWHSRNYHDFENFLVRAGHDATGARARNRSALDEVRTVALSGGIDAGIATSGFSVTVPIKEGAEFTDLPVFSDWQIASGFAHARPWAHHGFLHREKIATGQGKHSFYKMTARGEMTIYFPLQALHLLGQLLRLRDRRAGLDMPPLPGDFPDGEPQHARRTTDTTRTDRSKT
ncbi:hypothetical protein [Mycolicibacterium pyrenivorans]|uniref:hypothetical protein n=1 Tax=Mycolicibacterium pyrenivorans TaxID=187102 RepID=UPI0021F2C0CD|nr:hypothetical protein [Mycolicibacterium pyrenivorans]MCV7151613.1 hypothetical protein [Mycolicibacterium pyrenivorans]